MRIKIRIQEVKITLKVWNSTNIFSHEYWTINPCWIASLKDAVFYSFKNKFQWANWKYRKINSKRCVKALRRGRGRKRNRWREKSALINGNRRYLRRSSNGNKWRNKDRKQRGVVKNIKIDKIRKIRAARTILPKELAMDLCFLIRRKFRRKRPLMWIITIH